MAGASSYLTVHAVARRYGAVQALHSASITVREGEIHGLVGENGAGKSTLVRIMAGIEAPDAGWLELGRSPDGTAVRRAVVPQYPRMAADLTVWQNLLVGDEPRRGPFLAARAGRDRIEEIAERYDIALDLSKPAGRLGGTEIRLAALLAALVHAPDLLILDEPTVGLAATDQSAILATLRRYRDDRRAILYISHDLSEVCQIADRVTPLRQGRTGETLPGPVEPERLATLIFGVRQPPERAGANAAAPGARYAPPSVSADTRENDGEPVPANKAGQIEFQDATIRSHRSGRQVGPLTMTVSAGTIAAITGVRESGLDLLEQYFAGEADLDAGALRLDGRRLNSRVDPARLRQRGLAFVPSDRFDRAAALSGSVEENAILQERAEVHPGGFRTRRRAQGTTRRLLDTFGISVSRVQPLSALSGGTIQKLILARELDRRPRGCIIAEPTAGLDLQAQEDLLGLLRSLAETGSVVVILTSSIRAARSMADQIHVLHDGALAGTYHPHEKDAIARAFAGIPDGERGTAAPEGCQ